MAAVEQIGARPHVARDFWTVGRMRLAGIVVLLGLWEAAGSSGLFFAGVLPSSVSIARALFEMVLTSAFWGHFAVTATEVLVAFALGGSTGVLAGLILGANKYAGAVFEPFIHYLAPTPKIVFLPILLVLFGVGMGSKIALGTVSAFFPMALSVVAGVRQVSPVLLRVGKTFNLTTAQMVRMIYLPALVPPLATGLRIALGISIVGCLLAEYKLARAGLGYMAGRYYEAFNIAPMLAVLVLIFICAALGNALIEKLVRLPGPADRRA
ncbi:MAG: ABC transporter permease [Beijerinckiaceae bacterium]|nr:ABC transporter permease [Beijerinckiaceae bacterium]